LNEDQELVIAGYIPGTRGFDALLVGYYQDGKLIFCGKIRNGFKDARSKERVFARFKGLGTMKCPFANLPEPANARRGMALTAKAMKLCCWLKPKLVAQIGIREWTPDGHLRHSTFLGLREDKNPREVVRERA
jgi:ATP-dependent DNA ligase